MHRCGDAFTELTVAAALHHDLTTSQCKCCSIIMMFHRVNSLAQIISFKTITVELQVAFLGHVPVIM